MSCSVCGSEGWRDNDLNWFLCNDESCEMSWSGVEKQGRAEAVRMLHPYWKEREAKSLFRKEFVIKHSKD